MKASTLQEIIGSEAKKLTIRELTDIIYELKKDCHSELIEAEERNDRREARFYSGEINAFNICLDLLDKVQNQKVCSG